MDLRTSTMGAVRAFFETKTKHRPSGVQLEALDDLARALSAMAEGTARPAFYLSSVDPGVGKTVTLRFFLRALLDSPYRDVGAIVCLGRKREIESMVEALGLLKRDFAVLTADPKLNVLSPTPVDEAPILLTTQQMIDSRCRAEMSFESRSEFFYRGAPRRVRAWDEEANPGVAIVVSRYELSRLLLVFSRGGFKRLADALDQLSVDLRNTNETTILIPDFEEEFGVSLNMAMKVVSEEPEGDRRATTLLWMLSGRVATVTKDTWKGGNTIVSYADTLPADLAPMVMMDASGRVRGTYAEWETGRGTLVRLKSAPKRYDNLTIHLWKTSGGKKAYTDDCAALARGIAETITRDGPAEKWLVVHHEARKEYDLVREMTTALGGSLDKDGRVHTTAGGATVNYLPYGEHMATNRFAHVRKVILAGCLYYSPAQYEALGRLSSGANSSSLYPKEKIEAITRGEFMHHVLQAACRGSVRCSEGDGCPKSDVYLIASLKGGTGDVLDEVFPGCKVVMWCPVQVPLKGRVAEAILRIKEALNGPREYVRFSNIYKQMGMSPKDFRTRVRWNDAFKEALAAFGCTEGCRGAATPNAFIRLTRVAIDFSALEG